jgi:hypothetical protein
MLSKPAVKKPVLGRGFVGEEPGQPTVEIVHPGLPSMCIDYLPLAIFLMGEVKNTV